MRHSSELAPYRIGLGRDLHEIHLKLQQGDYFAIWNRMGLMLRSARQRSWWGLWQAEWAGCQRAVRGLTAGQARRRSARVRRHAGCATEYSDYASRVRAAS